MKRIIASVFAAAAALFLTAAILDSQQTELSEKMIRLHVVANSDDAADQELKLQVRDAVLSDLDVILDSAASKDEAEKLIAENLTRINETAEAAAKENGSNIKIVSELRREPFPTRGYDTFSLPAGYYTSLKITIGSGEGHNWWCVVYPKVCSDSVVEKADFESLGMTEQEAGLITGSSGGYVFKFKLVELIEELKIAVFG